MTELATLVPRFMTLFAGLERAHGVYHPAKKTVAGEKVKGKALTRQEPVTAELWRKHLAGEQGLGVVPIREDGTVVWGVIDVDVYDLDLPALEKKLTELQLPLVTLRTKSGGAHLYLFCAEPITAQYARAKLTEWAVLIGFPGVEIFPKQTDIARVDTGNWLNMPYFNAADTTRYAIFDGQPLAAEEFVTFAEGRRVLKAALEAFIIGNDELFDKGPPCLQHLAKVGFPRGSRNRGLFNLGVLARFARGDDWRETVEDFNRLYMQPPLSSTEVLQTIKSVGRKQYFYTCTQEPIVSVCSKEICRGRKFGIGNNDADTAPVVIDQITKIMTTPPMYIVAVEGASIQCSSSDLLSQLQFRRLVMEKTDRIIPMLKGQVWDALLQDKLTNAEKVDAPVDAGPEGQLLSFLQDFCTSWAHANNRDEILLGKPWLNPDDDHYYFRSRDFEAFLEHQHFRSFSGPERWEILRRSGATSEQRSIKGATRNVWRIPMSLFTKQIEEHHTPRIPGDDL
jgi:hypothetical protein